MSSLFDTCLGPVIIGHRGSGRGVVLSHDGRHLRENTLASCLYAAECGADWVEVDVTHTADGTLVLSHDLDIPVHPRGRRRASVATMTAAEAASCGLTLLNDLFEGLPERVGVIVEVKEARSATTLRTSDLAAGAVANERSTRPARPLLLYGFHPATGPVVRSVDASIPRGVIAYGGTSFHGLLRSAKAIDAAVVAAHTTSILGPFAALVDRGNLASRVGAAHAQGREVMVWTPAARQIALLAAAGVDAVCVDDVLGAVQLLRS